SRQRESPTLGCSDGSHSVALARHCRRDCHWLTWCALDAQYGNVLGEIHGSHLGAPPVTISEVYTNASGSADDMPGSRYLVAVTDQETSSSSCPFTLFITRLPIGLPCSITGKPDCRMVGLNTWYKPGSVMAGVTSGWFYD